MGGVKKSVYVFLCSLLGVLLFLVLQRVIVTGYLVLIVYGVAHWTSGASYIEFMAIDYITLLLAMLCGSWYGIWLGIHWYEQVYERGAWRGTFSHIRHGLFPTKPGYRNLKAKVEAVAERLSADLAEVEKLMPEIPENILKPAPVRRPAPRKRAVKKAS